MNDTGKGRYLRRFLAYALDYKGLLAIAMLMGIAKFTLAYSFPWVIGSAVDYVIAPARQEVTVENRQLRQTLEEIQREFEPPGPPDVQRVQTLAAIEPAAVEIPSDEQRMEWLWVLLGLGLIFTFFHSVATYGRGFFTAKLGNRVIANLRQDLFDHLHRLSLHFYSKERTGSIVARLITDIQQASQLINGGVVTVIMDMTHLVVGLALLLSISWELTLATMAIMPFYAILFKKLNPQVKLASARVQSQLSKISGNVQERLAGIALIKTYAAEERERDQFHADTEEHFGRVLQQSTLSQRVSAFSEGLIHIGQMIVIGMGGYFAIRGWLTPGDVVKFIGWLAVMYLPVRRFAEINVVYQTSLAAIERVFQVFDITPKIVEKSNAITEQVRYGEVVFDNAWFSYFDESDESRVSLEERSPTVQQLLALERHAPAIGRSAAHPPLPEERGNGNGAAPPRWILSELSFTVPAGQRVALVGPSGSGKTTLVSLLPRLFDVSRGSIRIDGHDLRDFSLRALRRSIGIVQQDSFLFSGSVRDNIAYGRPDATDEQVMEAALAANAHDFIVDLPEGYQSLLGERGVNLSGGQRQRLSIARAILKDPRILILDEATSALDSESEVLVQEALSRLMQDRTCFIIAHRLSTVRHADAIYVLQAGRVVEVGRHDELVAANGLYARLVRQQFGLEAEPAVRLE